MDKLHRVHGVATEVHISEKGIVETACGFMQVDIIKTKTISAFGHTVRDVKVQIYDLRFEV